MPRDTEKESVFSSETVVFPQRDARTGKGNERRAAAVVLQGGVWGTDQGPPRGAFAQGAAPEPVSRAGSGEAEPTSLGQSVYSAGAAGHMCVWKRKPELIKMKSVLPLLAVTCLCTSLGQSHSNFCSKN